MRLRPLRRPRYGLPGDTLVSEYLDGPQRVRARGARNRAENRAILYRYRVRNPARAWREACAATEGSRP